MNTHVAVIDYGRGNLYSIVNALKFIGANVIVTTDGGLVERARLVIVPGVGAFAEGMKGLRESGQDEALLRFAESGRVILGICLGCQMLMSGSNEFGWNKGLNLIPGDVIPIPLTNDRIPNVGWRLLRIVFNCEWPIPFPSLSEPARVYFVHSFHCLPKNKSYLLATSKYGDKEVNAIVGRDNIIGFQFHPEKSGVKGLEILRDLWNYANA